MAGLTKELEKLKKKPIGDLNQLILKRKILLKNLKSQSKNI
jgi:hypothetical protein